MVPGRTSGVRLNFRRIHLGAPSPPLSPLGFFLLSSAPFRLFACTLSPPLGATSLLLLLPAGFLLLFLSFAPLAASLVLRAPGLLGGPLRRGTFPCFFLGTTGTASSAPCFPLGVRVLAASRCLVVCGGIGSAAARFGARLRAWLSAWVRTWI
jgi:hypothetical protein